MTGSRYVNVADVTKTAELLHGEETQVHADAGYTGVEKRAEIVALERMLDWQIARKRGSIKTMAEGAEKVAVKASGRVFVEHPFPTCFWPGQRGNWRADDGEGMKTERQSAETEKNGSPTPPSNRDRPAHRGSQSPFAASPSSVCPAQIRILTNSPLFSVSPNNTKRFGCRGASKTGQPCFQDEVLYPHGQSLRRPNVAGADEKTGREGAVDA